jgi:hypothetical protein
MTEKQMLLALVVMSLITIVLIVEIGSDRITKDDIVGIVAFIAGAGFVVAFMKNGRK